MRYTYYNAPQRVPKLTAHLAPVHNYTCTMQELLLIVNLGGLVTKTKSILMYKVEPYARGYLVVLQKLRRVAISQGNKPLSNLLKLMGNGIYGKFNQSNMKHLVVKLISTIEEYEKTMQSQRFKSVQFHKRNCLTTQRQRYVRRNGLSIVATHILGSSEARLLYKYYYVLKPAFTIQTALTPLPEIRLCYIDTDCLVVYIRVHEADYIRIMKYEIAEHFDISNLPNNHPLYNTARENRIGILNVDGQTITSFYVSTAKYYKAEFSDGTSITKCKGVPKSISKTYTSQMYRDSVFLSNIAQYSTYRRIGVTRRGRETALIEVRKRTLNDHNTKRIITVESTAFHLVTTLVKRRDIYSMQRVRAKHYNGIITGVGGRSVTYTVRKTPYWRICIGMLTT